MNGRRFTINLYGKNHDRLHHVLENISEEAKRWPKLDIQVILLDGAGDERNAKEATRYQETGVVLVQYMNCEGKTSAQAFDQSRELWTGEYVTFITENMTYEKGALFAINRFIQKSKSPLVCLTPTLIDNKGHKRGYLKFNERNTTIDLMRDCYRINLKFNSFFAHVEELKEVIVHEDIRHQAYTDLLLQLFKQCEHSYGIVEKKIFIKKELEIDFFNYPDQYSKSWYTEDLKQYILPTLKNATYDYEKYAMLYLLIIKFACNMNDRNKDILLHDDLEVFFDKVKEALQYIPDHIISQYESDTRRILPRFMGLNLLRMKYEDYDALPELTEQGGCPVGVFKEVVVEDISNIALHIKAINYEKDNLVIDGAISNAYFLDFDQIKIKAKSDRTEYEGVRTNIYSFTKFFNKTVQKGYTFSLLIPVGNLTSKEKFVINLEYMDYVWTLDVRFDKIQSRLYEKFCNSYWCFGNYMLKYCNDSKQFLITNRNPFGIIINEILFTFSYIRKGKNLSRSLKCMFLRLLYWITRPYFYKKQIWLTYDQMFKGGDNGEYFYRYVSERRDCDNIKIYYVINKNAKEYKYLKEKYGTVLGFNSIWHKVISLHSTAIFATRVDVELSCGYWSAVEKYVRDLFNAEIMCLQHGLTIQKIAQYQNRLHDNIKLYFCVSPYEIENLSKPIYGYKPEQLLLTGAPRYDGLKKDDKRYILISPTWRRSVTAGTNKKGHMHTYSENFKRSEYFKVYNSLINNNRLLEAAKKYNYQIKYLIHPVLSQQIKDFDANDFVEIIAGAGDISYEKILTEASLMVTDYSGIQFDYANLNKPLIYYHPSTLPPQYAEGGLDYVTEGFGPVCINEEEVVNEMCEYMSNQCELNENYRNRIKRFFTYQDKDNCKRVYESAVKYLKL